MPGFTISEEAYKNEMVLDTPRAEHLKPDFSGPGSLSF